ncbi:MAG: putative bifunctional diguanylate cyclase/phosphodiesterase [Sulfuriferula sp.]
MDCALEPIAHQHGEAEQLIATSAQLARLQQANENLLIATIEAHKLAEQVQLAKVQMLDHLAHHDALTNLPNRLLLQDRLTQAVNLACREGRQMAVLFFDMDRFKLINDSLGHAIGDLLLQSVAQRLAALLRQSDTLCRLGGDEFVLLLPNIEHPEDAALLAQKILTAVPSQRIDQSDLHIGVSIGISIYPDDGEDGETLLKNADTAMYHAKDSGRNNYKFFEPRMDALAAERQNIESGLRCALEQQEFVLYYQPKIDLHSGAIVGVEALIRWQHPQRGLLSPAHFIPVAEDCGLILPMGRWVLRAACLQAQVWRQAGFAPITIAVNTSALELRAPDFLAYICATLADTNLQPQYLEIELTESVLMRDATATNSMLLALADMGIKLAIDDFGTGFSSLSYLRNFPIKSLKIDQSFVDRITRNADDATLLSAIIAMGKSLRHRVIAEGVETEDQYQFLRAQQCDEAQGHFFGSAMTAQAFTDLLKTGVSTTAIPD